MTIQEVTVGLTSSAIFQTAVKTVMINIALPTPCFIQSYFRDVYILCMIIM